jgi:hypothetical protein
MIWDILLVVSDPYVLCVSTIVAVGALGCRGSTLETQHSLVAVKTVAPRRDCAVHVVSPLHLPLLGGMVKDDS